jgi:hypothetical protein
MKTRMSRTAKIGLFLAGILGLSGAVFLLQIFSVIRVMTAAGLLGILGTCTGVLIATAYSAVADERKERILAIQSKADAQPEKAKFAWELASAKLESYFDRNLAQVNAIFWLALVAMVTGFALVIWGIVLSIQSINHETAWVAAASGVLTEFISVTFMVIYRSTMSQAKTFVQVLEKINTVGMSVQILDSLPDGPEKNTTRAELVKLLLKSNPQ